MNYRVIIFLFILSVSSVNPMETSNSDKDATPLLSIIYSFLKSYKDEPDINFDSSEGTLKAIKESWNTVSKWSGMARTDKYLIGMIVLMIRGGGGEDRSVHVHVHPPKKNSKLITLSMPLEDGCNGLKVIVGNHGKKGRTKGIRICYDNIETCTNDLCGYNPDTYEISKVLNIQTYSVKKDSLCSESINAFYDEETEKERVPQISSPAI